MNSTDKIMYFLGQRDALAELFAEIRLHGEKEALVKAAAFVNVTSTGGEHPHAKWYLKQSETEATCPHCYLAGWPEC